MTAHSRPRAANPAPPAHRTRRRCPSIALDLLVLVTVPVLVLFVALHTDAGPILYIFP